MAVCSRDPILRRRERLRRGRLLLGEGRLSDLRNPVVLAEIRREAVLLAQHPENAAIDDWIDAVYDVD